jgi:hypothetical protein
MGILWLRAMRMSTAINFFWIRVSDHEHQLQAHQTLPCCPSNVPVWPVTCSPPGLATSASSAAPASHQPCLQPPAFMVPATPQVAKFAWNLSSVHDTKVRQGGLRRSGWTKTTPRCSHATLWPSPAVQSYYLGQANTEHQLRRIHQIMSSDWLHAASAWLQIKFLILDLIQKDAVFRFNLFCNWFFSLILHNCCPILLRYHINLILAYLYEGADGAYMF